MLWIRAFRAFVDVFWIRYVGKPWTPHLNHLFPMCQPVSVLMVQLNSGSGSERFDIQWSQFREMGSQLELVEFPNQMMVFPIKHRGFPHQKT